MEGSGAGSGAEAVQIITDPDAYNQCSGSVGSVCFWASRIRILIC